MNTNIKTREYTTISEVSGPLMVVEGVEGVGYKYAPAYAALALKQAEGSIEEAVFLLRAYRSTLSRNYYTLPASGTEMNRVAEYLEKAGVESVVFAVVRQ